MLLAILLNMNSIDISLRQAWLPDYRLWFATATPAPGSTVQQNSRIVAAVTKRSFKLQRDQRKIKHVSVKAEP